MNLSELLKDQTNVSCGTVDLEGKPKVRIFTHQFITDGKICFSTATKNSAYAELKAHPFVEITQFSRGNYIRISGEIVFAEGQEKIDLKAKLRAENEKMSRLFTPEKFEEMIEIIYFKDPQIKVMDYTNRQPIEVEVK